MRKAEERAREAYPDNPYYGGRSAQRLFAEGYEQAEKDFMENAEKWFIVRLPIILDEHNPISVKGIFEDFRKEYDKRRLHEI